MNILVIGGSRYFGKILVTSLRRSGHDVWVLNRGISGRDSENPLVADRRNPDAVREAIGTLNFDVVFDQICYEAGEAAQAREIFEGRVGTYVLTSSQSVYGFKLPSPIQEAAFVPQRHHFTEPAGKDADYSEAKRQAETVFASSAKFPVLALRPPIVLGDDDYTGRLDFHVKHVLAGTPFKVPNPEARLSFIEAGDLAAALDQLGTAQGWDGYLALNCASPEPISIRDLIGAIEKAAGKRAVFGQDSGEPSPFGVLTDWYMDTSALQSNGVQVRSISEWLPGLLERRIAFIRRQLA